MLAGFMTHFRCSEILLQVLDACELLLQRAVQHTPKFINYHLILDFRVLGLMLTSY